MARSTKKNAPTVGENDELFELIQSLSKAERRYFKIHFNGTAHGDLSSYEKLFDAMAAMKELDAPALDRKFSSWTGWKYYSKTKHYLITAIFDAMRAYHKGQSLDETLYDQAASLRFLKNRGLYSHFEKLLAQTKAVCYETEMLLPLLDVLANEEAHLSRTLRDPSGVHQEIVEVLRDMQLHEEALQLNRRIYSLYKKHGLRPTEEATKEFNESIEILNNFKDRVRLINTKSFLNSAIALCHHCLNNQQEAVAVTQRNLELLESMSPRAIRHNAKQCMLYLSQMITFAFNSRQADFYDQIKLYAEEHMQNIEDNEISKFELSIQSNFLAMIIHQDYSNVDRNAAFVDENRQLFRQISIVIQGDVTFNMSLGYLKTGNLPKALEWLLRVFEIPEIERREQIFLYARLYEILLHWKLGHIELVLSKTLSFKRFLNKQKNMGEFERVFIRFMNAAVLNDSTDGFAKAINNFAEDLQKLDKAQYAGITASYTDLLGWFRTK